MCDITLNIETINNRDDMKIIARDIDHALHMSQLYRHERHVTRVFIMRRNRVVGSIYDARHVNVDM